MHRKFINPIPIILIILLFFSIKIYAQTKPEEKGSEWIKLSSPSEGATIIEKRPLIKCSIAIPFTRDNLLITLDQTDVTAMIEVSKDGFEFKPIQVLSSGQHKLNISLTASDKKEYKREFSFAIRHSRTFEEVYSTNDVSVLYEGIMRRHVEDTDTNPTSKIETNITSNSKIKEKGFEATLNTNIRYFEQNFPVEAPTYKGFNIPNYLLSVKYGTEKFQFLTETGDVQISETQNTANLSKRGIKANVGYGDFRFSAFGVKAQQVVGLRDYKVDSGLQFMSGDRIQGVSGEVDLFKKKANFKIIHVTGEDKGESFGTWSAAGGQKGETTGFLLKTDFFSQKLATEMEYDVANFDQDTSDTIPAARDEAYRFRISGQSGKFNYEGFYEYFGTQYSSIGNTGVQKDREGFTLKGGGNFEIHSINLSFSQYNDNVKKVGSLPRVFTYQEGLDYNFTKFKSLPMGINYQRTHQKSMEEPAGTVPTEIETDIISGKISFIKDPWNLGFNANYSNANDIYNGTNDNTNMTLGFAPAYSTEHFSVTPNFSWNRVRNDCTNERSNTYTVNLNVKGNLLNKKLDYETAYTFNKIKATDESSNSESTNINFRVGYRLAKQVLGLVNPTIGIRGTYSRSMDRISDTKRDESTIFLFFSTNTLVSF